MVVNARFASGALASFLTGCFPLGGHSESPDGGIGLLLSSRNHRINLTGWHFDGTVYSGDNDKSSIPREENIFAIQDKAFLDAVATGDTSGIHSPYDDSLKTLAVSLAANDSARNQNGRTVEVGA